MITLTRCVFQDEVASPYNREGKSTLYFQSLSKKDKIDYLYSYRESVLERKVYEKVINEHRTVEDVFYNDKEVEECKKALACIKYMWLVEHKTTYKDYVKELCRQNYKFDCPVVDDMRTRFDIYKKVKLLPIKQYLYEEQQTAYNFF